MYRYSSEVGLRRSNLHSGNRQYLFYRARNVFKPHQSNVNVIFESYSVRSQYDPTLSELYVELPFPTGYEPENTITFGDLRDAHYPIVSASQYDFANLTPQVRYTQWCDPQSVYQRFPRISGGIRKVTSVKRKEYGIPNFIPSIKIDDFSTQFNENRSVPDGYLGSDSSNPECQVNFKEVIGPSLDIPVAINQLIGGNGINMNQMRSLSLVRARGSCIYTIASPLVSSGYHCHRSGATTLTTYCTNYPQVSESLRTSQYHDNQKRYFDGHDAHQEPQYEITETGMPKFLSSTVQDLADSRYSTYETDTEGLNNSEPISQVDGGYVYESHSTSFEYNSNHLGYFRENGVSMVGFHSSVASYKRSLSSVRDADNMDSAVEIRVSSNIIAPTSPTNLNNALANGDVQINEADSSNSSFYSYLRNTNNGVIYDDPDNEGSWCEEAMSPDSSTSLLAQNSSVLQEDQETNSDMPHLIPIDNFSMDFTPGIQNFQSKKRSQ